MEGMREEPFWISGLTVSALLDRLKLYGLECEGPHPRGETMSRWECEGGLGSESTRYEVVIVGQDAEHIRLVEAKVSSRNGVPPRDDAAEFMAFVASIPHGESELLQAQQWAREKTASGGKMGLSNVNLEMITEEQTYVLRMVASEPE